MNNSEKNVLKIFLDCKISIALIHSHILKKKKKTGNKGFLYPGQVSTKVSCKNEEAVGATLLSRLGVLMEELLGLP